MQSWRREFLVLLASFFLLILRPYRVGALAPYPSPNGQRFISQLPKISSFRPPGAPNSATMLNERPYARSSRFAFARSKSAPIIPLKPINSTEIITADPEVEYRKAVKRTALTISAAVAFGVFLWAWRGRKSALEFFAGYLVEQSLSVDNLFVFIMLFDYFKVPLAFQPRVLTWGILGAVLMRGAMIAVGVAAIQRFRSVILLFAGVLLVSAYKLLQASDDDTSDLDSNLVMRLSRLCLRSTPEYDGERFFTKINGIRHATPLLMCLVCIELSDFVFAVDSIPAVLGVSHDPLIVYSSNIFAIMGLRSLYTLVSRALAHLPYLRPAVAVVLAFVGAKMVAEYGGYVVSTGVSLAVVAGTLALGVGLSLLRRRTIGEVEPGYDVRGWAKDDRNMV